jgi:hypothetical protein
MKQILIFCLFIVIALNVKAGLPNKAAGIRGGLSSGFEYRVFSSDMSAYKVLLSFRQNGIQLTGMKEFFMPATFDFSEDFNFVYGFGAHAGFAKWRTESYSNAANPEYVYYDHHTGPVIGLDGLAALEYTIPAVPLIVGIEIKPYFNLLGKNFFQLQPFDFAFTVKYSF